MFARGVSRNQHIQGALRSSCPHPHLVLFPSSTTFPFSHSKHILCISPVPSEYPPSHLSVGELEKVLYKARLKPFSSPKPLSDTNRFFFNNSPCSHPPRRKSTTCTAVRPSPTVHPVQPFPHTRDISPTNKVFLPHPEEATTGLQAKPRAAFRVCMRTPQNLSLFFFFPQQRTNLCLLTSA